MPTIASGSNATITVAAGQILTVQSDGATFDYENPVGTRVGEYASDSVFGPFTAAGSVKLTSVQGPLFYEVGTGQRSNTAFDPSNVAITGGVSASLGNTDTGVYNVRPQTMRNLRKAFANVLGGAGNGRILCVGDSTTMGTGSVAGGTGAGVKNSAYPARLTTLLTSAGLPASGHSAIGTAGFNGSIGSNDTRISLGSWTTSFAQPSIGGSTYFANATTASPLAFTPTANTDTCEIYYGLASGGGTFNANVNGGANTLVSTASGGQGVGKVVITGTLGANTYNCLWASGSVSVMGWIAYDSTQKQVQVVNSGFSGARAQGISSDPWAAIEGQMNAIAPNLTILEIGINNWIDQTAISTFTSQVQRVITAALAVGDCLLVSPINSNPATYSADRQAPYTAAIASLASSNGVPYLDLNRRWNSFADANAFGLYYTDGIHCSALGYADEARAIAAILTGT